MGVSLKDKQPLFKKPNCRAGFTLLELLLAITAFSLILGAFYSFYGGALQAWKKETANMDLQQNARIAFYEIVRELRYARKLEGLDDETILPFYNPGAGGLQQGTQKIVYVTSRGEKCEFAFNAGKRAVTHKINGGPPNEVAYSISRIDFFRYRPQGPPGGNGAGTFPMVFVRLEVGEEDEGETSKTMLLQSFVRLQNIAPF
ncbi:MAG: prepilin-type N-terminal cleavage/methylation domain-containing protein [Firmicutes bacterium]|nr:prepilin-type N-terminal cleavage/methylation domain-containing protein [Bacillota bacterium]